MRIPCSGNHSLEQQNPLLEETASGWGSIQLPKRIYTGKHFDLPKSTEKTHARRGLYALWITILCVG